MKLHSDFLEASDLRLAARHAGVRFTTFEERGSRSRAARFDVILSGSSSRNQNFSRGSGNKAATWDEWGVFLAILFFLDPRMVSTDHYSSGEHFDWATAGRYRLGSGFSLADQHRNHRWEYSGEAVTGAYSVHACTGCNAVRRFAFDFEAIRG